MYTLILLLGRCINILELLLVIRCILSWIPGFYNTFVEIIYKITDPFLTPVRNLIDRLLGGRMMPVDFSPIVLWLILELLLDLLYSIF